MAMDTSRMEKIKNINSNKFLELLDRAKNLKRSFDYLYKTIDNQVLRNQVVDLVENHYDLGTVQEVYEVFGGYTNRSFGIICEKDGARGEYFVRKYKAAAIDEDVELEHKLINYAISQGFKEAARIYINKEGTTFVKIKEIIGGKPKTRIFAVYEYLGGEDKYTWIDNECTPTELKNLGALLARLHNSTCDFKPQAVTKAEPRIEVLLPEMKRIFDELGAQPLDTKFHDYFNMSLPRIKEVIDQHLIPAEDYAQMPQTPIHGDYHAGNVKFEGEETTGLFDFDWSKVDVRLFDVCLGLVYCCSSWHVATDGQIRIDDCRLFLEGYNSALDGTCLPKFNEVEKKRFSAMMTIAAIYLVYWCTELWYYLDPEGTNDYESIYYLTHFIRNMKWIAANEGRLAEVIASV
ncbi:homoserine kinase [Deltaproteobacteria bacterium Smac51]|nr:homoserine kinase [Deltaproteobacteria bacterium Smac51]